MGDDQKFEYIYKFVSDKKYDPANREANMQLLTSGTLYVARFNEDGSGDWLPLIFGQNGLDKSNGFENQGDLLIKTRLAADAVGATKMDRPEWIAVDPHASGSVYCTLTNNSDRGKEGKAPVDAANPRANNVFGHIMHWHEEGADPAAARFKWDILVMGGRTDSDDPKAKGSMQGRPSAAPMACRSIIRACCGSRPTSLPAPSIRKPTRGWAITRWWPPFRAPTSTAVS
jgi:secreted PhoX family phosphatase